MAYQVIKQPDGNFCVFSTFRDSIIGIDMTKDGVIEFFMDMERRRLNQSIGDICEQLNKGKKPYCQFTKTFKDAAKMHFSKRYTDNKSFHARIQELQKLVITKAKKKKG